MFRLISRHPEIWLSLLILVAAVALRVEEPRLVSSMRAAVFDTYQRLQPRPYQPSPIRIVDIDDETLALEGQWPWPRTRVAELVARLRDMGAAVIVFDFLFAEPDRTSPAQILPLWSESGTTGLDSFLDKMVDHDQVLADAIGTANVVTGFVLTPDPVSSSEPEMKAGVVTAGINPRPFLPHFGGAIANLAPLEAAAMGNGALNFTPDRDGVIRRVPLVVLKGDEIFPTLSSEALRVAQGASSFVIKATGASGVTGFGAQTGVSAIQVGGIPVPTDGNGRLLVHYTDAVPERFIPAWRILDGSLPDEAVQGMIVLLGTSAAGLMDLRSTPLHPAVPGVMVHAQVMEQVINQAWLLRPDWADGAEMIFLIALGLLVILLSARLGAAWTVLAGGLALAIAVEASWLAYTEARMLLDPVYPGLTVGAVYLVASLVRHILDERQRKFVEDTFSSYVSPNLVQYFIDNPDQVKLGGERRDCSFVMTDLAGFTTLVEQSDPAELVSVLNEYLEGMTNIAFDHEGTLDNIIGDAVAIMFSAPVEQPDHAQRAIGCALEMDAFAQAFSERKQAEGVPLGLTRIGVNTGVVIIGNIGGKQHSDYRSLGDPINTAARLETVNKHLGTRICVSGATVAQVPDFIGRRVATLVLKGKSEGVEAYEPLTAQEASSHRVTVYNDAFDKLDLNGGEALAAFEDAQQQYPDDPLVEFHLARLNDGETGKTVVMTEK